MKTRQEDGVEKRAWRVTKENDSWKEQEKLFDGKRQGKEK